MAAQYNPSTLSAIIRTHEATILNEWVQQQIEFSPLRRSSLKERELREQSQEFLAAMAAALDMSNSADINKHEWSSVRDSLGTLSRACAKQGLTPSETAMFVFSLKQPLFAAFRKDFGDDGQRLASEIWHSTTLLDQLGLFTMEVYQKGREEVILRQQQELMELSTPVVQLWDQVLALPLIGTLDSARTQVVMENLLQQIVDTGAEIAIIDITGVPTVDTLVAQHLLKTVAAARLMGADCIISGIRPQIAQTIVHLGVDLGDVITKATLADAFQLALQRNGLTVTSASSLS